MEWDATQLLIMVPEIFLVLVSIALLMLGAFRGNEATGNILLFSSLALVVATYLSLPTGDVKAQAFGGMYSISTFTQFAKVLILISGLFVMIIAKSWLMEKERKRFEFPVLMLLSIVGMMLMVSANDLLALYMGLEMSSLALYVLAAFDRDNLRSSEAGLKYFILGSLASGMMLFGSSLVYGFAGSTSFSALAELFAGDVTPQSGLLVGLVMVVVGFCFKVSAVPFHMWTPDVYEGAPTPVTALFATAPKIAAIALFVRFMLEPFGELQAYWQQIIVFVSIASMVIGALGALVQTNIKRLLAYSSIGHMGYALIGLAAGTAAGVQGILIYLTLYIFMSVGVFGFISLMKRQGQAVESIYELGGLSKTCPKSALFVAVMMFSMAGIPPLAGFFGKFYVFLAAIEAQLYTLAVIGVLSSVVAAYYYIKVVKIMYFDEEKDAFDGDASLSMRALLALCALVTLFFFLNPTPLVASAAQTAQSLWM